MFTHPWNKFTDNLITYTFAVLIFFVPLVFWPTNSELFEFNKMMLTYLLAGIIVTSWITQAIINKQLVIRRSLLDIPILLFLSGQIITTIFSINPHTSIWGYYSRFHGGLASTITYILLFYIFTSHFSLEHNRKKLKFILYSILSSTSLIALYGILEHFGIDKHIWVQDVQSRVFSTLGQPNWLSAYLVAILPLPLLLALNSKDSKLAAIFSLISFTVFTTILFTKSRSGIATTLIIIFLIFIFQLFKSLKSKLSTKNLMKRNPASAGNPNLKAKKPLIIFALTTIITIFLIGSPWSPNPSTINQRVSNGGPIWQETESYFNKLNLSTQLKPLDLSTLPPENLEALEAEQAGRPYGGSNSWDIRQVVWEGAFNLFKKHPLTGTGLETFGYSYYWAKPATHNLLSEWDFLYNKAHNEYINFLATTGIVGISTYALLILATLFLFLKTYRSNPDQQIPIAAISFGYLSILITNYFGFSVVPVALLFFLYPATAITLSSKKYNSFLFGPGWLLSKKDLKNAKKKNTTPPVSALQHLLIIITIITLGFWTITITKHWFADLKYSKGKSLNQAGYLSQSISLLESATNLYPSEPVFRAQLAEAYANASLATKQQLDSLPATQSAELEVSGQEQLNQYATLATQNIDIAISQNPWHLNFIKSKAKIELTLAQIDPQYYSLALNSLLKANELAPTDAKIIHNIGLIHLQLGNQEQAETAFRQAVSLKPNYDQALAQLATMLIDSHPSQADALIDQLLFYYPTHPFKETYDQMVDLKNAK